MSTAYILENLQVVSIVKDSFRVAHYGNNPFRMIGLVDVNMIINDEENCVTIPVYRSSGTNNNKVKGAWYPIIGVKLYDGEFIEFSKHCNKVSEMLNKGLEDVEAGWLAKSLFFREPNSKSVSYMLDKHRGYSYSRHNRVLKEICDELKIVFDSEAKKLISSLGVESIEEAFKLDINTVAENFRLYDKGLNPLTLNYECHRDSLLYDSNLYEQALCFDMFVTSIYKELVNN